MGGLSYWVDYPGYGYQLIAHGEKELHYHRDQVSLAPCSPTSNTKLRRHTYAVDVGECGARDPCLVIGDRLFKVFHEKQIRQVASVSEDIVLLIGGNSRARNADYTSQVSGGNRSPRCSRAS